MSKALFLVLSVAITASVQAAKEHDKQEKVDKHPNCQQFTQGLSFNDSQALGTWHLLHYKTETDRGLGGQHCVEFSIVNDEDRKNFSDLIGKYVENLNWDKLVLKMQIPCTSANTNRTRDYFLEKLEDVGSYRTLQVPPPTAKLDLADFHRYPMRLKLVEGQYLGMMDCHEKFVFLLGKQPPQGTELDDRLKKMIDTYWPEEN